MVNHLKFETIESINTILDKVTDTMTITHEQESNCFYIYLVPKEKELEKYMLTLTTIHSPNQEYNTDIYNIAVELANNVLFLDDGNEIKHIDNLVAINTANYLTMIEQLVCSFAEILPVMVELEHSVMKDVTKGTRMLSPYKNTFVIHYDFETIVVSIDKLESNGNYSISILCNTIQYSKKSSPKRSFYAQNALYETQFSLSKQQLAELLIYLAKPITLTNETFSVMAEYKKYAELLSKLPHGSYMINNNKEKVFVNTLTDYDVFKLFMQYSYIHHAPPIFINENMYLTILSTKHTITNNNTIYELTSNNENKNYALQQYLSLSTIENREENVTYYFVPFEVNSINQEHIRSKFPNKFYPTVDIELNSTSILDVLNTL